MLSRVLGEVLRISGKDPGRTSWVPEAEKDLGEGSSHIMDERGPGNLFGVPEGLEGFRSKVN